MKTREKKYILKRIKKSHLGINNPEGFSISPAFKVGDNTVHKFVHSASKQTGFCLVEGDKNYPCIIYDMDPFSSTL